MSDYILSATELNDTQNHDDFWVLWLGSPDDIPVELGNLAKYSTIFHSCAQCKEHIEKTRNSNQFLLVLIGFDDCRPFDALRQVQSIYIFRKDRKHMKIDKHPDSKLTLIFHEERHLMERIRQDILLTYRTDSPKNIFYVEDMSPGQTFISFDQMTLFLWNRLLNYYLINTPAHLDMVQLKEEMIERCRLEYSDNQETLKTINRFDRTCTADNAIQWYKEDSFVYRLVNQAFRKHNVALLWKLRYFIILLHNQLQKLSIEQQGRNLTTVYRGQILERNYITYLETRVGQRVSTSTILSTTRREDAARFFIANAKSAVLFQINVAGGGNRTLYPFADISRLNAIGAVEEEGEVLFFAGAVFRIDSVKHESHSLSIINLTLMNENIEIVDQLNIVLKRSVLFSPEYVRLLEKTDNYELFNRYHMYLTKETFLLVDIFQMTHIDINRLIDNADDHQKAIKYYEELLLLKKFIDPTKYTVLLILIGLNYFRLKQYDYAIDFYTEALKSIDDGNRLKGEVYKYLGDVWKAINDLQVALLSYEKAIQIIVNHEDKYKYIGEIYRKIAQIYFEKSNYEEAFSYQSLADAVDEYLQKKKSKFIDDEAFLKCQQQLNIELDVNMLQHAHTLYTNGMGLIRRGRFSQGLKELLEAEPLLKDYLPVYDLIVHKLAKLYEHAAFAYFCFDDYCNALVIWKKAIDIRSSFNC